MRHFIPFIIAVLAALPSCIAEAPMDNSCGTLELAVWAGMPSKAQASAEYQLHSITLLVFDKISGELERTLELGEGATEASLGIKAGPKAIFAYANHSVSPSQGATLAMQPITGNASLVQNAFASSCFAMRGSVNVIINAGEVLHETLYLERCASRIVINSIDNRLPNNLPLTVTGAFLADAYTADTPGTVLSQGQNWTGRWGRSSSLGLPDSASSLSGGGFQDNTVWSDASLPHTIANGTAWAPPLQPSLKGARFYCMPNTAVENGGRWESGATWTPRTTKLVLIARIGNGSTCYYSIPMPLLQANESRELNIHIHGAGTDDPEELAGTVSCDVSGITAPYEHGATYTDNTCP